MLPDCDLILPNRPSTRIFASFLANVISGWSIPATTNDQSNATTFKGLDLQVAKYGTSFNMVHKMGLVKITLGTKSVPTTRNYSASGSQAADATGMKYTDSGTTEVTASNSFDTSCSPYSSLGYWYIVRGSKTGTTYTKTFKSVTTVNTDWEYKDVSVDEGNYQEITVENTFIKRLCYKFTALFTYTGAVQEFTLPVKGTMTVECWGADGGADPEEWLGKGGYTKGTIDGKKQTFYIYVGENGYKWIYTTSYYVVGGWNGGGTGCAAAGGGGGATDVRLIVHSEDNGWGGITSLRSRIMVAAGGGGFVDGYGHNGWRNYSYAAGGHAGGLWSLPHYSSGNSSYSIIQNTSFSTQTSGQIAQYSAQHLGEDGAFGKGGDAAVNWGGGGGGGWYGGAGGCNLPRANSSSSYIGAEMPGGGGTSFISGHPGCNAVDPSTGEHLGKSTVMTIGEEYRFSNTQMIDGSGKEWTDADQTTGGSYIGIPSKPTSTSNGYARIILTTPVND